MDLNFNLPFPFLLNCTFVVFLLLFSGAFVESEPQVVGETHPIVACPGDDVILPCHVEPAVNVARRTVEWSKPDSGDQQEEYVHLHRHGRENLDMKKSSFMGRTELFTDELKRGNISLRILRVTLEDEGTYRCFIPKLESRTRFSIVHLRVVPHPAEATKVPPHVTSLQNPGQNNETEIKDGVSRSRLIPAVVFLISLFLSAAVVGPLAYKFLKQKLQVVTTSMV